MARTAFLFCSGWRLSPGVLPTYWVQSRPSAGPLMFSLGAVGRLLKPGKLGGDGQGKSWLLAFIFAGTSGLRGLLVPEAEKSPLGLVARLLF